MLSLPNGKYLPQCVTAVVAPDGGEAGGGGGSITPALGLAWSSQLTTRLTAARTGYSRADSVPPSRLMQLSVASAPHLAPDTVHFRVGPAGVEGVTVTEATPLVRLTN
ncbi:hypothetical protein FJT64_011968 [Amphibalanus amphitrite]|uniref:Uncharacterized protein n=1 Tax=Amphibalanus amphitrite TaxID=1232801 RepID=A0A6A4VE51_AMPAM|nr:hypothetical protein FJT64_011968 [Amphibalanus amphitrite]